MSNVYWLRFGAGNPASFTALSPTFLQFNSYTGGVLSPPGITEPIAGSGLYQFTYTPSFSIAFIVDGATTGIADATRYIVGNLDPNDMNDVAIANLGATVVSIGSSSGIDGKIGSTASAFGDDSTDPGTLFGYMKRIRELLEGAQSFNKNSGAWALYSRGFSTMLASKVVSNSSTGVTRS